MQHSYNRVACLLAISFVSSTSLGADAKTDGAIELFNGKDLTVYYCAPSMRGRKIMGDIVPYGKVWRTGANTSTTFHTQANLRVGDTDVPAGTYTLYSLPSPQGWKLIINRQVGQWGTVYHQAQDFARIPMTDGPAPGTPVQEFKISFEHTHGNKTQLHLIWETTNVYVPITATK